MPRWGLSFYMHAPHWCYLRCRLLPEKSGAFEAICAARLPAMLFSWEKAQAAHRSKVKPNTRWNQFTVSALEGIHSRLVFGEKKCPIYLLPRDRVGRSTLVCICAHRCCVWAFLNLSCAIPHLPNHWQWSVQASGRPPLSHGNGAFSHPQGRRLAKSECHPVATWPPWPQVRVKPQFPTLWLATSGHMVGTFKGFPRLCPWMMRRCRKGGASIRWEVESICVNYGGVWTRNQRLFHPGLCIFHSVYMTCLVSEWHTASMAKARSVQLLWSRWVWQHLHGRVSGWCWRGLVASTDPWISWFWQCRMSIYCETLVGNRCNSVFSSLELMLPQIFIFLIPCKVFETGIYVGMVDWCPVAWTECVARMLGTISATCRLTSLAQRTGCRLTGWTTPSS